MVVEDYFNRDIQGYPVEKEFQINKYLKVKLINSKSIIFVNDKPFNQCKYLLLNLTKKSFKNFKEIDSIDEAFQIYNRMEKSHETQKLIIDPETEFIGHCSNLQVWYENDYDLRILHTALSVPLLKKLADVGEKRAVIRLKEEIAKRIVSENSKSLLFYLNEEYLAFFTKEELETLFIEWLDRNSQNQIIENRRIFFPLLRDLAQMGIKKAKCILREEIWKGLTKKNLIKYKFVLTREYLQIFSLEELEDLYMAIPIRDHALLRPMHSLIIQKALKKRRQKIESET